jgi:hypothetical protein
MSGDPDSRETGSGEALLGRVKRASIYLEYQRTLSGAGVPLLSRGGVDATSRR